MLKLPYTLGICVVPEALPTHPTNREAIGFGDPRLKVSVKLLCASDNNVR